jgi:hypothetical protein
MKGDINFNICQLKVLERKVKEKKKKKKKKETIEHLCVYKRIGKSVHKFSFLI